MMCDEAVANFEKHVNFLVDLWSKYTGARDKTPRNEKGLFDLIQRFHSMLQTVENKYTKELRDAVTEIEKQTAAQSEPHEDETRLYISNIKPDLTETELRKILTELGPSEEKTAAVRINKVYVKEAEDGRPTWALVQYQDKADAAKAISLLNRRKPHNFYVKHAYCRSEREEVGRLRHSGHVMVHSADGYGYDAARREPPVPRYDHYSARGAPSVRRDGRAGVRPAVGRPDYHLPAVYYSENAGAGRGNTTSRDVVALLERARAAGRGLVPVHDPSQRTMRGSRYDGRGVRSSGYGHVGGMTGGFIDRQGPIGGPPAGISLADLGVMKPVVVPGRGRARGLTRQLMSQVPDNVPVFDDRIVAIVRNKPEDPKQKFEKSEREIENALDCLFPNDGNFIPTYASLEPIRYARMVQPVPPQPPKVLKLHVSPIPSGINRYQLQEIFYGKTPIGVPGICKFLQPPVDEKHGYAFIECYTLKDAEDTILEYNDTAPYYFRVKYARGFNPNSSSATWDSDDFERCSTPRPHTSWSAARNRDSVDLDMVHWSLTREDMTDEMKPPPKQQLPPGTGLATALPERPEIVDPNYLKVTFILGESPDRLFLAIKEGVPALRKLMYDMRNFYRWSQRDDDEDYNVGDMCAVHDKERDEWHRAVVCSPRDLHGKVEVLLKDVGRSEVARTKDMQPLDEQFTSLPFQIIRCHLANLKPEGKVWPASVLEYLGKLFYEHGNDRQYITQQGPVVNNSIPVVLRISYEFVPGAVDPSVERWTNVNDQLVELGLAVATKERRLIPETKIDLQEVQAINQRMGKDDWVLTLPFKLLRP